jgi:membrane protease subunit (stomatin/prohibitin family)
MGHLLLLLFLRLGAVVVGVIEDVIHGPFDKFLKTENFPILTSLVSLGWDGQSPFNAEVYFINLQDQQL